MDRLTNGKHEHKWVNVDLLVLTNPDCEELWGEGGFTATLFSTQCVTCVGEPALRSWATKEERAKQKDRDFASAYGREANWNEATNLTIENLMKVMEELKWKG